jgi:integrase
MNNQETHIPLTARRRVAECPFSSFEYIDSLEFRDAPYWHTILLSRHVGIYRPNDRVCTWTARFLTKDKRYRQRRIGPALDTGKGAALRLEEAVELAFEWFASPEIERLGNEAMPFARTSSINCCPIGDRYTVGHALKDYVEWTSISRSPGGHYNNLVLINYHLIPNFAPIPLEDFKAKHLAKLALQVLETPPRFGFERYWKHRQTIDELSADQLRRRKRTFNSLVSILRMAFRNAWENGHINSERPWRCLRRVAVNHSPRTIFLDREECRRLIAASTPALGKLVQAALYTGCRVGELSTLRVEDVAYQMYGIRVEAFKRSPARYVFLPDEGMAFFLANCEGKSPRDYVFLSDMGKCWRKQHTGLFRRAVSIARLPTEFVFHGLRHTYASDLVRQGVPLDIVAKQLGHASTATVSNTYGHLAEHYRESQIRTRFTPLDPLQQVEAARRSRQLESLWEKFQRADWREYGRLSPTTSEPKKTYTQTHKAVLDVFQRAAN